MIPDAAIGAVVAAVIAATLSLLTLIISKENKTSEFRQEWINEFRKDIASAISSVATINLLFGTTHQTEHKKEYVDAWSKTSEALALVELRLNLLEADHKALQLLIREAENLIRRGEQGLYDQAAAESLQDRVVLQTQAILKREWDRVRDGEPVFQLAKSISAAVFTFLAIGTLVALVLSRACPNDRSVSKASNSKVMQTTNPNGSINGQQIL